MGQVALSLNDRTYRFVCDDGDEARLRELAQTVEKKLDALVAEFGNAGEARLLVMAALMLADDVLEASGSDRTEPDHDGNTDDGAPSNDP